MHPQKKSYLFLLYSFSFFSACIFVGILLYFSEMSREYIIKSAFGCFILYIYFWGMDYKNRSRKYIKFYDTYVRINAYHKKSILKVFDLNILYKDIRAVRLKNTFVFGITYIEIDVNSYGKNIKIHRFYKDFKGICKTLYDKMLINVPEPKIDEAFVDFIRRKE